MDAFLGVNVDGFESNENTKSEMFTDITESLSLFSDEKKTIWYRHILCNINLNCPESM